MGSVQKDVWDAVGGLIDGVYHIIKDVWDAIAVPILEFVFGLLGIVDEDVVHVQKVSTAIYSSNTEDVVKKAKARAVISFIKTDTGFMSNYIREIYAVKGKVKGFYNYAERGNYIHGLPTMEIRGGEIDNDAIGLALNDDLVGDFNVLSVNTTFPTPLIYFKHDLQNDPLYNYIPSTNTITFTDPYGVVRTDYTLTSVVINQSTTDFDITVSRISEQTLFWIEGPDKVTEGEPAVYTLFSNRVIPVSGQVTLNISYSGTATDATDYVSVLSVDMIASTDRSQFTIQTIENVLVDVARDIIVTLSSIDNTNAVFEDVAIGVLNSVTTSILDDDSLVITLNSVYVEESDVSVTIPVTMEQELSVASVLIPFTVDYSFTDITTLGGVDYDNTGGTLSFTGAAGETQNIVVSLTADIIVADREQFEVILSNCSDPSIDITRTAIITIVDTLNASNAGTVTLTGLIVKPNFVDVRTLIITYHDVSDPDSNWYFWFYDLSTGIYPDIDPKTSVITGMEMLPIAILRRDKINIDVDKSTAEYRTTKRLLDFLQLDIDEFIESLNANDDIGDVTDAYINISMNPLDTNSVVSKLLWNSFYEIIVANGLVSNTNEYVATFIEQDVNNSVVWSDQEVALAVIGSIGLVGTCTHTIGSVTTSVPDTNDPSNNIDTVQKTLLLRHQVDATTYDQILLTGLSSMSAIAYDGFHNVSVSNIGETNFTIPVSLFVFNLLDAKEQLEVYQYLLRFDVFAIQVTHLEWYETSAFSQLFKFVAIVITIVSLDFSGGVYAILQELVINYLIGELVTFIAIKTGNAELAAVIGLVASFAFSGNADKMFDFSSAEGLLMLSTNFADNLTSGYGAIGQEIANDMVALNAIAQTKLDDINDIADENLHDSPIDIDFLAAIRSVNTTSFPAINAQYEFDEIYNYDKLVGNFHDTLLTNGVI